MSREIRTSRFDVFVDWLESRRDDRAIMAELRRGFSPGTEHYVWKHLAPWCELASRKSRTIYTAVAACYAFHPECTAEGNLGTTLRRIAQSLGSPGEDTQKAFEGRLRRLLACVRSVEVCRHLRQIIGLASQHGIPINYRQLLKDLLVWDKDPDRIKVSWAAEYWRKQKEPSDDAVPNTNKA